MTANPGLRPCCASFFARSATSARIFLAIARPSISSAGKVHCSRLPDQHDFDLSRILKLCLDAPSDLLGESCHARIVDFFGRDYHAHFAPRLNREHLLDAAIARCDLLQPLEA